MFFYAFLSNATIRIFAGFSLIVAVWLLKKPNWLYVIFFKALQNIPSYRWWENEVTTKNKIKVAAQKNFLSCFYAFINSIKVDLGLFVWPNYLSKLLVRFASGILLNYPHLPVKVKLQIVLVLIKPDPWITQF